MYRKRKTAKQYHKDHLSAVESGKVMACVFCKPDARPLLIRTKHSMVLSNAYPYDLWDEHKVEDHLLAVPRRHTETFHELTTAEQNDLMQLVASYEAKHYNVYWRAASNSGKSVPHLHIHLIKVRGNRSRFRLYLKKPYISIGL